MKLFDKRAKKIVYWSLIAAIPFTFFVLWKENGKIGIEEIIIVAITLIIGLALMQVIIWYSNKD